MTWQLFGTSANHAYYRDGNQWVQRDLPTAGAPPSTLSTPPPAADIHTGEAGLPSGTVHDSFVMGGLPPAAPGAPDPSTTVPAGAAGGDPALPSGPEGTFITRSMGMGLSRPEAERLADQVVQMRHPNGTPSAAARRGYFTDATRDMDQGKSPLTRRIPDSGTLGATELREDMDTRSMRDAWRTMVPANATTADSDAAMANLRAQGWEVNPPVGHAVDRDHPPVLSGRREPPGPGGTLRPLTSADRAAFARDADRIKTANLTGPTLREDTERREFVNGYLSRFGTHRDSGMAVLQGRGLVDAQGNPTGTWSPDSAARDLYDIPAGTPVTLEAIEGANVRMPNQTVLGRVDEALHRSPPDFAAARTALDGADPVTRAVGTRAINQGALGGIHTMLTSPRPDGYGMTEADARAWEYSQGLTTDMRGTPRSDLDTSTSVAVFNRLNGPPGRPWDRPSAEQLKIEGIRWFREHMPAHLRREGLNGGEAARYMYSIGALGDEETMPEGTLGRVGGAYVEMEGTRGNRTASDALGRRHIAAGDGVTLPTAGRAGDQARLIREEVNSAPTTGPEGQAAEAARNRIHSGEQADADRRTRRNMDERRLDLDERKLARESEDRALDRQQRRWETELTDRRERWRTEGEWRQQELNRQNQMLMALVQGIVSILSAAMQAMTAVYSANMQALAGVNQGIFQSFGRR